MALREQMGTRTEGKQEENLNWLSDLGLQEYVALDLETTGLDAEKDQIIEIGAIRFRDGKESERFEQLIDPKEPLDPFITALTGITDENLRGQPIFADVAPNILKFIGDSPLVGQNISFDLEFLASSGKRLSSQRSRANPFLFAASEVLDTAQLGRVFWPEWPRFGLASMTERFGVKQEVAHRALADARTTGNVLCRMMELMPERIWEAMARDLAFLIGGTFHRSERFFGRLATISEGRKAPRESPIEPIPSDTRQLTEIARPSPQEIFGEDGCLKKVLADFECRPAQLQMAEAIQEALEQNRIFLCEAPTGVGKSLAYLVASALWTSEAPTEGRQVVVSSHTKALQEQLHRKEMKTVQALGIPAISAVLKGRENYLCRRRLQNLIREAPVRLPDEDRLRLMPLVRWAATTSSGDISEIGGFQPNAAPWLWSQVCNDAASCSGSHCGAGKGCFFQKAKERAANAQIVFVNHALLFSDPARFLQKPSPLRKLVLDEGHHVERAVVGASRIELNSFNLRGSLMRLVEERGERGLLMRPGVPASHGKKSGDEASELLSEIRETVARLYPAIRSYFEGLAVSLPFENEGRLSKIRFRQGDAICEIISSRGAFLLGEWSELLQKSQQLLRLLQEPRDDGKISKDFLLEFRSSIENLVGVRENIARILTADDDDWVFWAQTYGGNARTVSLHACPVFIGADLQKDFWPLIDTAAITSATLSTQGNFEHCRESLGLDELPPERLREEILPSPFALSEQMRLFVPVYLPNPRRDSEVWISAVENMTAEIVRRFRRGTLILTTSLELLERLGTALMPVAKTSRRTVLVQGRDGAPAELLEEFRQRKNAVLVGTANFWEGIDVIGEALEILIVTRLPFDVPTEPWIAARMEKIADEGKDAFYHFSLPEALLRLRQGLGRLIRHRQDRGIALIADSRVFSTKFGAVIREGLPVIPEAVTSPSELWQLCDDFFGERGNSQRRSSSGD
jgi:predicted DnaQ family exonuclease/DinG family helicase